MSPRRLTLAAPAKVNLGLRVLGRREDGYHLLDSLFVPLDLADELEVELAEPGERGGPAGRPRVELSVEAGEAPGAVPFDPAENLAGRAARAFLDAADRPGSVRIRLRKRIPAAGGLGGGSSDAAAVLRALAELAPGALSQARLVALALELGADVPFFLDPRPARVRGIGEQIAPAAGVPPLWLVLANPGLPLATAEVYAAFDALRPDAGREPAAPPPPAGPALADALRVGDDAALAALLRNDLEVPAVRLCPPVARLRAALRAAGARAASLSGSGPTLFGVFPDRGAAEKAAGTLAAGAGPTAGRDAGSLAAAGGCGVAGAWTRVARTVGSG